MGCVEAALDSAPTQGIGAADALLVKAKEEVCGSPASPAGVSRDTSHVRERVVVYTMVFKKSGVARHLLANHVQNHGRNMVNICHGSRRS